MMASIRTKRLRKELQEMIGICEPMDGNRLDVLKATITGEPGTPYEHGSFELRIEIPETYPFRPPRVRFLTKIYHPNIDQSGVICLDILKANESVWKSTYNLRTVLTLIKYLMSAPNPNDPLEEDIASELLKSPKKFDANAKLWTRKYAMGQDEDNGLDDDEMDKDLDPTNQQRTTSKQIESTKACVQSLFGGKAKSAGDDSDGDSISILDDDPLERSTTTPNRSQSNSSSVKSNVSSFSKSSPLASLTTPKSKSGSSRSPSITAARPSQSPLLHTPVRSSSKPKKKTTSNNGNEKSKTSEKKPTGRPESRKSQDDKKPSASSGGSKRPRYEDLFLQLDDDDDDIMEIKMVNDQENTTDESMLDKSDEDRSIPDDPCEVCKYQRAKYNCPACRTRTCSLVCVKAHKINHECDGIARRTKMVTMDQFDALTLLSDYRFLEEATRVATRNAKILEDRKETRDFKKTKTLTSECGRRGIRLALSPWGMEKSLTNTTLYNPIAETIFWRIEWIFVDAGNFSLQTDKNIETLKLETLLRQFLKARPGCDLLVTDFNEANGRFGKYHQSRSEIGDQSIPWTCYLKCERSGWTKDTRYYKLDNTKTICENLKGKALVEFPTIFVASSNDQEESRFPALTEEMQQSLKTNRNVGKNNFGLRTGTGEGKKKKKQRQRERRIPATIDGSTKATSDGRSSAIREQAATQSSSMQQPLRRLLRPPPPPRIDERSNYNNDADESSGFQKGGKKVSWNPFAAKRIGKRKAIDDLAEALTAEKEELANVAPPKVQERRYADVVQSSEGEKKSRNEPVAIGGKGTDYFSLLGFQYASESSDEEGEIHD